MAFYYCLNHFVLAGLLSSDAVFAAASEAARAVRVTAVSPCGSDFTEVPWFSLLASVELLHIAISEV